MMKNRQFKKNAFYNLYTDNLKRKVDLFVEKYTQITFSSQNSSERNFFLRGCKRKHEFLLEFFYIVYKYNFTINQCSWHLVSEYFWPNDISINSKNSLKNINYVDPEISLKKRYY